MQHAALTDDFAKFETATPKTLVYGRYQSIVGGIQKLTVHWMGHLVMMYNILLHIYTCLYTMTIIAAIYMLQIG